jgi:Aspartyl protease
MSAGPEREYVAGILANRTGHIEDSIRLLQDAIPQIRSSQPGRTAIALQCLADDFTKRYQYADAARAYDDLLAHFASELAPDERQGSRDDSGVMHLLKTAPPQTISWNGPTRLKTERNPFGAVNTELTVNGVEGPWLLDTGANLSVVSSSFARRLGLHPLPGYGQTMSGMTALENRLQVAVLPTLKFGGATLHNVVLLILDDKNLNVGIGKKAYQINAILGFPVFQSLGVITFLQDGEFEAGATAARTAPSARMFMNMLTPLIECGANGKNLLFAFDTGASASEFSIRYFKEFHAQSTSWQKAENASSGAGGIKRRSIYLLPRAELQVADKTVTLDRVPIFPTAIGSDIDEVYGNLGQDVVANFDSFTLNFANMTFSLGNALPSKRTP